MAMKVRYNVMNGEVFSETRGGVRKVYIPDALGNTVAMMDNTGAITDTFDYFPSGTVASRTGTNPTPFQWNGGSGYFTDSSTRKYVRARNYFNSTGRWGSQDPIGFSAGDFNLYRYVNNRFVTAKDPSGLACELKGEVPSMQVLIKKCWFNNTAHTEAAFHIGKEYTKTYGFRCNNETDSPNSQWNIYQLRKVTTSSVTINWLDGVTTVIHSTVQETKEFVYDTPARAERPYCPKEGLGNCWFTPPEQDSTKKWLKEWMLFDDPNIHSKRPVAVKNYPGMKSIEFKQVVEFMTFLATMSHPGGKDKNPFKEVVSGVDTWKLNAYVKIDRIGLTQALKFTNCDAS